MKTRLLGPSDKIQASCVLSFTQQFWAQVKHTVAQSSMLVFS